ncbi:hypothetical protein BurJ1DRAFT_0916 [Burkholderiales bacterium JOSHI_001]|nr:hypothetical protein BurJ1DRAFT_0916 [Burkholderiales bacterium JOSHI_001]
MTAANDPARRPRRAAWLWSGLAVTLALTLWTALQPEEAVLEGDLAAPRAQRPRAAPFASGPAASAAARSDDAAPPSRTAWATLGPAGRNAWTPPPAVRPPPPPKPAAPMRPVAEAPAPAQAPLPPFTLIGRYQDSRGPVALLATPQRTLAVREGELADPQWRVDTVATQGIELTWLPGAQKRILAYPPGT